MNLDNEKTTFVYPVVGLFVKLSKEQQQAALTYVGPFTSGNCDLPCIKR